MDKVSAQLPRTYAESLFPNRYGELSLLAAGTRVNLRIGSRFGFVPRLLYNN